jgi:dolichol-phosphate mannosyltransferase
MKTAVVIPTYNECDNIPKLIAEIFDLGMDDLHIVVVDDNSPDGTGKIVEEIKKDRGNLHVIHRKNKMGLGTAYLAGFRHALDQGAQFVFEMDADFSHDPKMIPIFLEEIRENDLVIGSRYVKGGSIEKWNYARKIISHMGNLYARAVLNLKIKDLTTGYKCYRKIVLEKIIHKDVNSVGYVFQVETKYRTYQGGFRIKEIPITFTERKKGKSKFDLKIIRDAFWKVLKLRVANKK